MVSLIAGGRVGRARTVLCAGIVVLFASVSTPPPTAADPGPVARAVSCADRKAGALDWIGYFVWNVSGALTSSLKEPQIVPASEAAGAMRRIDRWVERVAAACPGGRFAALSRFAEQAHPLTTGAMDQETTEDFLAAFDAYQERQTDSHETPTYVQALHRCQKRLPDVRTTYQIHYSAPKPFGRYGWVTMTTENDTDRSVWVNLDGSMVVVRPLPRQGGEYVAARGGWVYGWGGSSSDSQFVDPGASYTSYASPSWYRIKLQADGFIKAVRPEMWVTLRRLGCSSPVWPS